MKKKTIIVTAAICAAFLGVGLLGHAAGASIKSALLSSFGISQTDGEAAPTSSYISVVGVKGTISNSTDTVGGYSHAATVAYVGSLAADKNNAGLLLDMDTPGGGVYESDELYLAVEKYKEATGRPVWVYMNSMCASGGYYVSMAADWIVANRNCTTGSIGVIINHTDYSGLYDKLGVSVDHIASGANKAMGSSDIPLTEAQRAIYQAVVDEAYNQFVEIICTGRSMERSRVLALADGRIYTASQALSLGLIDGVDSRENVLSAMCSQYNAQAYAPTLTQYSFWQLLFSAAKEITPKNEAETLKETFAQFETGVPLYLAAS